MNPRIRSNLRSLSFSALLLVGCGGSTAPNGTEGAAGQAGASTAGGGAVGTSGAANGGAANGGAVGTSGAANGGAANGGATGASGAAHGGAANGGASGAAHGGAANGGAVGTSGAPNGGAANGGAGQSTQCSVDMDCVNCAYTTAPAQASDCYCANCALTPLAKSACTANQAAWQAECSGTPRACPAIACVSPAPPMCKNGMCMAEPRILPTN